MKKILLLIIFCSIYWHSYSQDNKDLIMYKADGFYCIVTNEKDEQVSKIPLGRDPTVFYDKFFKRYDIWYYDKDGVYKAIGLTYLQDDKDGFIRVMDTFKHTYLLLDKLSLNGKLVYIGEEKLGGYIVTYVVENAVKVDTDKIKY